MALWAHTLGQAVSHQACLCAKLLWGYTHGETEPRDRKDESPNVKEIEQEMQVRGGVFILP